MLFYYPIISIKPNEVNHSKKLLENHNERKKSLMKLISDLEHYYQFKHKTLDNNIKQTIINYFLYNWYLYTDEDIFYNSIKIINDIIQK